MSELVIPKNELAKRIEASKIVAKIIKLLEALPSNDIIDMRINPELVKYICNLVENLVKNFKPDKKRIVLDIMKRVIPNFTANDEKIASDVIEFLHSNKQIKKHILIRIFGHNGLFFLKFLIPIPKAT